MNNKQKLHQIKLTHWAARFQEQAASGLSVKVWCAENNVTIHTYNYWKHKLKLEYIDSMFPAEHDIIALTPDFFQTSSLYHRQKELRSHGRQQWRKRQRHALQPCRNSPNQ